MNEAKRISKQLAAGLSVVVIALAIAAGVPRARQSAPVRATAAQETVRLPDLTDPVVRKWFADSFGNGYFTQPLPRRVTEQTASAPTRSHLTGAAPAGE
jgi:hypothetical protein